MNFKQLLKEVIEKIAKWYYKTFFRIHVSQFSPADHKLLVYIYYLFSVAKDLLPLKDVQNPWKL